MEEPERRLFSNLNAFYYQSLVLLYVRWCYTCHIVILRPFFTGGAVLRSIYQNLTFQIWQCTNFLS